MLSHLVGAGDVRVQRSVRLTRHILGRGVKAPHCEVDDAVQVALGQARNGTRHHTTRYVEFQKARVR